MKIRTICRVKGCNRKIHVKMQELCQPHYLRFIRNGTVNADVPVRILKTYQKWNPADEK